ncbi:MAG: rhomboid family intramembrane serine protease [Bacteroidales bacterium]|nr:rhomboid family intramembrane serine protease [Bacteroidales bacterium]
MSLTGGLLVWTFARASTGGIETYHVGASLTIFGLLGFLIASGIFRKRFRDFIIALIIGIIYGGALWGILPSDPHVSWESHLFGFAAGIFWAYVFRKTGNKTAKTVLPNTQMH